MINKFYLFLLCFYVTSIKYIAPTGVQGFTPGRFKGLGESRGGKGEIEIPLPISGPSGAEENKSSTGGA